MKKNAKCEKANYMNVLVTIRELKKLEMVCLTDGIYRLDRTLAATQKEIQKVFSITETNVRAEADTIRRR